MACDDFYEFYSDIIYLNGTCQHFICYAGLCNIHSPRTSTTLSGDKQIKPHGCVNCSGNRYLHWHCRDFIKIGLY